MLRPDDGRRRGPAVFVLLRYLRGNTAKSVGGIGCLTPPVPGPPEPRRRSAPVPPAVPLTAGRPGRGPDPARFPYPAARGLAGRVSSTVDRPPAVDVLLPPPRGPVVPRPQPCAAVSLPCPSCVGVGPAARFVRRSPSAVARPSPRCRAGGLGARYCARCGNCPTPCRLRGWPWPACPLGPRRAGGRPWSPLPP